MCLGSRNTLRNIYKPRATYSKHIIGDDTNWLLSQVAYSRTSSNSALSSREREAQLAQSLGFDLANALARNGERLANLLQRPLRTVLDTKTHPYDLLFPRTERSQHVGSPLLKVRVDDRLGGRDFSPVFDEVAEV